MYGLDYVSPMERASEDEVVIRGKLLEAGIEFSLVDESTSFVDNYEGEDDPGIGRRLGQSVEVLERPAHMLMVGSSPLKYNVELLDMRSASWTFHHAVRNAVNKPRNHELSTALHKSDNCSQVKLFWYQSVKDVCVVY